MSDRVTCRIEDGVADVRLNRPDKMNAIDPAMFAALRTTGDDLKSVPGLRAVVVSGEGRAFCAGLDRASFDAMLSGNYDSSFDRPADRLANDVQHSAWVWTELPVPVIAAVHGAALGGGLQVALGADLRVVSPNAQLSLLEAQWGIVPDMGGTYVLPRLVGLEAARDLIYTSRTIDGVEAVRLGLASRLSDDPRTTALEMATTIANCSPDAIRAAKRLLGSSLEANPLEQLRAEETEFRRLIGAPNQVEAVTARLAKRAPSFTDVEV